MNYIKKNPRLYNKYKRYWKLLLKDSQGLIYTQYQWYRLFDSMTHTGGIVNYLIKQDITLKDSYEFIQDIRQAHREVSYLHYLETLNLAPAKSLSKGLRRVLRTSKKLQPYIKNTLDYPYLANGPIEGINNKTKVLKQNAYGYLNYSHFRARILLISRLYASGKSAPIV